MKNIKEKLSLGMIIIVIILLPFFIIYWLGVLIWYVQGRINGIKSQMEEIMTEQEKNKDL